MSSIELPDILPYLFAILCLTLIWKFHDLQVKAGRIQARDFWERSGVRFFLRITPNDALACSACRETTSMVFFPAVVTSNRFSPQERPCINLDGCRCLMIGLYGDWPEAKRVLEQLKLHGGRVRLADAEVKSLIETSTQARAGASADRISLRLVHAMRAEGNDRPTAIDHYRYIVDHAKEERDRHFVVPSFLRLSELYARTGQPDEALTVVERCLQEYGGKKKGPNALTETQRAMLEKRRAALMALAKKEA
ncbi:MAG TPA: hypothetical protein VGQ60_01295 [Nitrospiraceae bacterium]|jgi:hypothetical protein|nr:hypothetical protein [Nitrospiraceae bacterium]